MPVIDKFNFNKTAIEQKIMPLQKTMKDKDQRIIWEKSQPGFGLKVSKRKVAYVAQAKSKKTGKTERRIIDELHNLTIDEAREKAREIIKEIQHGELAPAAQASITLRKVLEDYLKEYDGTTRELRPTTKTVYEKAMRLCLSDWLDVPLGDINEAMVKARHKEISNANGPRGKGEAMANQTMRVLRTLFYHAMETYRDGREQPIFTSNPVRVLKAKKLWNENKSRKDFIEDDDLALWYQAVMQIENPRIRDYFLLCLFTGLRRGEAAKLKWENVKLQGKRPTLRIPAADAKTNNEHMLPLPGFVVDLLKRQAPRIDNDGKNPYVFPGEKDGSCIVEPKRQVARVIELTKKAQAEQEIEDAQGVDFSMHVLRRTFATVTARLDIGHFKHKKLMNHSFKDDITGHYSILTVEDLREPMEKICHHICRCIGVAEEQTDTAQAGS